MSFYVPRPCNLIVGAPCETQWLPVLPPTTLSSSSHLSTAAPASPPSPQSSTSTTSTATSSAVSSESAQTLPLSSSSPLLSSPSSQSETAHRDTSTRFGATAGVAFGIGAVVTALVVVTVIYAFRQSYHRKGRTAAAAKGVADGEEDEVKVPGDDTGADGRDVPDVRERRSSVNSETLLFQRDSEQNGSPVVQRTSIDGGIATTPRKLRKPRTVVLRTAVNFSPPPTTVESLDLPTSPREDGSESDDRPSEARSRGPRSDLASVGGSMELPGYADDGREHRDSVRKTEDRRSRVYCHGSLFGFAVNLRLLPVVLRPSKRRIEHILLNERRTLVSEHALRNGYVNICMIAQVVLVRNRGRPINASENTSTPDSMLEDSGLAK
ncbi:hypothetical protein C8Q80DRAFT_1117885 [Daedaleopsis nitida]|nr:hypothetical protein C8Q80DRAFT_1117885 [Daedaleopsis nitida]